MKKIIKKSLKELQTIVKRVVTNPDLSNNRKIIDEYHKLYNQSGTIHKLNYFGYQLSKIPNDLFIYAEIIYKNKPDLIIECGSANGGTTLFMAHILDQIGKGSIVSIDINDFKPAKHNRIRYILGNSVSYDVVEKVNDISMDYNKIMVILDSNHTKDHVLKEMKLYGKLVSLGQYLIVEDTDINGHPVDESFGDGAYEAVEEYMKIFNSRFKIDKSREYLLLTSNPNGYLLRIK